MMVHAGGKERDEQEWHKIFMDAGFNQCKMAPVLAMELIREREGAHELLQAQAHVWNNIFSFISSMSLKCAVQLGILDIIQNHGRPMTLSELVASLPVTRARASHVHRLMRLLVHSGFFALQKNGNGDEGYVLTASSKLLLKESRTSLSPFLLLMLDQMAMYPWHFSSKWFQGDE
ncbi:Flavonoid o-methyltransferase related [Cinnamomum micranthum f. kanehirae]|uniref:Flavonoid o-methyltransferase related n=1 Tax=Cinnamomum micranthum f. kanehirae TaxID=337451 RepID=A0A443PFT2_9MAGN|nr:Flavonoid o-methyltransferase related [Cinnamomum micranthum f. kanehirae]